jgi:hypothetical protein
VEATPVNRQQAKHILISYRPGIDDDTDPEISQALRLAEADSELKAWLENQRATHAAIRAHLHKVFVPPDLRWQILAGRKAVAPRWRRPEFLVAAAAIALLCVLSAFWFWHSEDEETFAAFRSRMVRFAVREYRMDIETNDMATVRQFLASKGAPADYEVARGLAVLQVAGGGCLRWRNNPVSMVCFRSGASMLYLFVLNRTAVDDPPPNTPQGVKLRGLATVSWTSGENTYVLAGPEEADFARKYL